MSGNLSGIEMRAALDTLHAIGKGCADGSDFARRGVHCLPRLISSELTTLSVCDLDSGHRSVVCDQPGAISRRELEVFDCHFFDHPLVREHGRNPAAVTRRIQDLLPDSAFQRTSLYNDYYRAIRIDHVMAVPIHVDRHVLVSFVVNRSKRGFSDRDRERVEVIRPHLGHLYRLSARNRAALPELRHRSPGASVKYSIGLAPAKPTRTSPRSWPSVRVRCKNTCSESTKSWV